MAEKKRKEKYEKPKVIYQKKIEVLADVCDSIWLAEFTCKLSVPDGCDKLQW